MPVIFMLTNSTVCWQAQPQFSRWRLKGNQLLLVLAMLVFSPMLAAQLRDEWQNVERIVVVGDIHGDYDNYLEVLREAGLVNKRGSWKAGKTHFVQIGDLPDRGPDTHKIIAHMQKLEAEARREGGMVHALIGNHEAMNISGDLRYVHPGEYAALKSRRARQLQDAYYAQFVEYWQTLAEPPVIDEKQREQWNLQYPLGYVEHRLHWNPKGDYGKWVLTHNAAIKINDILFMHAGIGPLFSSLPLRALNEQVRMELQSGEIPVENPLFEAAEGPLWYRGLALNDEALELPHVQALLDYYEVNRIVIGHTPGFGTIIPRFDGRVVIVDSGISSYYGGHLASLLIENGALFNHQRSARLAIPVSAAQLPEYYRRVLELEPDLENLRILLHNLEHPEAPELPQIDETLLESER